MSKTALTAKQKAVKKAESLEILHNLIRPGDTVYSHIDSVSRDGMSRIVNVYLAVIGAEGKPEIRRISHHVAYACGMTFVNSDTQYGIRMPYSSDIEMSLGSAMFPDGVPEEQAAYNSNLLNGIKDGRPVPGYYALREERL